MANIFIYEIMHQKEIKLKQALVNGGMHPIAFWIGNFICDYLTMMIIVAFFMA